jgi:hypothetical protein
LDLSGGVGLCFLVGVTEAASGGSVVATSAVFVGTVAETVSAISALTVLREANVYPNGVQLYVYIGGVLVWAAINDNQTPNWVAVNDNQTPNWVDVIDTQTPGWTILPS